MACDDNIGSMGRVYRLHPLEADPIDGSGAADAPDGWYEPDRLVNDPALDRLIQGATADSRGGGPNNDARIVGHLKSKLLAFRRRRP